MESLRRLTSSVLDAGPVRLVRRASLGDVRPPDARSLGLTFISERLVVAGFPADAPTDKKSNRLNVDELAQYLDAHHKGHFMLFNLNALEDAESESESDSDGLGRASEPSRRPHSQSWRTDDFDHELLRPQSVADKLHEQMLEFNWERDGMKAHTPPFDLIFRICYAIFAWLSLDAQNVAVVNCQTGKTRSGVVVACYLLFARLAEDPTDAFVEFYRKRWDMKSLTPQALRKKTPPSIQRFLSGFHDLLEAKKPPNEKPLLMKAIIFRQLPVEVQPCVQIWDDYRLVFSTDAMHLGDSADTPVLDWNEEDGFFAVLWENGIELDGGFSILCSFGDDYDNADDVDASSRVLFRYADSTWFLSPGLVTLKKGELDLMKQYEHGFDEEQFSMDLVLHENSAKKRRSSVRVDYTGNNAVRQGLVEITKHHIVLPDPAMHSNFIRMGFCETPTTFALQCSQNAPNVALDLLHSAGLSTCFAQEQAELAAKREQNARNNQRAESPVGRNERPPLLRRQTTAEIVAMQSQRSRYSTPTTADSSLCDTCKEDDYMMRPQIVQCTGPCGKFYHTTCVGLRKIPFGLTTMSDRTNHGVYVKKFFSAWECDACAPTASLSPTNLLGGEIPSNMKLVPSSWVGGEPAVSTSRRSSVSHPEDMLANPQDVMDAGSALGSLDSANGTTAAARRGSGSVSAEEKPSAEQEKSDSDSHEFDQLKEFLSTNGLSVEDLMRAAKNPGSSAAGAVTAAGSQAAATAASTASAGALSAALSLSSALSGGRVNAENKSGGDASVQPPPAKLDLNSALLNEIKAAKNSSASGATSSSTEDSTDKYSKMLKQGVPFEAVQNCMKKDGVDESTLKPLAPNAGSQNNGGDSENQSSDTQKTKLKDVPEYQSYFNMLRMGCPKEAVKQKLSMDGLDPIIVDLGPEAIYDDVKDRIADSQNVSKLQDDIKCVNSSEEAAMKSAGPEDASDAGPADILLKDHDVYSKYFKMLKMGLPEGAVRQKMQADGVDERALELGGDAPASKLVKPADKGAVKLKDDPTYAKFFKMLKMGLPEGAVRQKMQTEGADERALELGGDALVSELVGPKNDVKLKDDPKYAKYFKMLKMGLPEGAVRQKMKTDDVDERALDLGGEALVSELDGPAEGDATKLQDDPTYAKYFKMLKMGLPEGAVRQKMKTEGADERALDLGPDALVSELTGGKKDVKLSEDPTYAKYFKMLKMGMPEGAVRQKMMTDNVDQRALELGPDATISQLSPAGDVAKPAAKPKPKRARKKLHWQPISEDRLSNLNQQTIWEDEDDDAVDFDMDMDELEALFFANKNTGSSGKKTAGKSLAKPMKRKQSVTLIDGKRAMNAAISLARVKLSYSEIAAAVAKFDPNGLTVEQLIGINEYLPTSEEVGLVSGYSGDVNMLGEAEKFIREISKVKRYGPRMECLVYKLSFPTRSAELEASLSNLHKACEEVKGSRLLKTLLGMVLKLGNTLNGSGEENEIRGFTVDSLLRLGHTKAVNQKTTVLHYLVRIIKKNHPQVLDFHEELRSVPLAARESFDTIDEDFKKLEKGLTSLNHELELLEKQATEDPEVEVTVKTMHSASSEISGHIERLAIGITTAREEVSSVFDYFGEDPKRNPTEFFTTLTSFCTAFQGARKEVDAKDEAAMRAERLKLRRVNTSKLPRKPGSPRGGKKPTRQLLERAQTERTVDKWNSDSAHV